MDLHITRKMEILGEEEPSNFLAFSNPAGLARKKR